MKFTHFEHLLILSYFLPCVLKRDILCCILTLRITYRSVCGRAITVLIQFYNLFKLPRVGIRAFFFLISPSCSCCTTHHFLLINRRSLSIWNTRWSGWRFLGDPFITCYTLIWLLKATCRIYLTIINIGMRQIILKVLSFVKWKLLWTHRRRYWCLTRLVLGSFTIVLSLEYIISSSLAFRHYIISKSHSSHF